MPDSYDEILYLRYKLKRKTTAQWTSLNPVLLAGEPGIEVLSDGTEKIKYGDGVKTWAQLSYPAGDSGSSAAQQRRHDWVAPYSYCGVAAAGVAESAAGWKVTRLTISTAGVVSATGVANPVTWTGRLGHSYS